jgi:hypothetical protein
MKNEEIYVRSGMAVNGCDVFMFANLLFFDPLDIFVHSILLLSEP